jgi:hypothetical protein
MTLNPNGASSVSVDLENDRQPSNLEERLLRTWPARDA